MSHPLTILFDCAERAPNAGSPGEGIVCENKIECQNRTVRLNIRLVQMISRLE